MRQTHKTFKDKRENPLLFDYSFLISTTDTNYSNHTSQTLQTTALPLPFINPTLNISNSIAYSRITKHLYPLKMTQLIKLLIILAATGAILGAPIMNTRQLAGEGNFFDSMFTDTDNGVGYGVENAEDNLAELLGGTASRGSGGSGSGGNPPPPPPHKMVKRQGDKIANGAAADLNAVGLTNEADFVKTDGGNIDGQLTDDATTLGAQFGGDEEDVLERAGNFVPNKVPSAGAAGH
ncbi:hypothetical protein HG530_009271 [Fusarium avenaceum]|nr:hypothetical protein HG530_009271 [Fusarium avenaceum]